ncbi:glycosyltransferase [Geodermatophilus maliterrae]|uniref:Glycosyltransferase n=1 Tax=Geodermatophilus maliterrae TaxID=3162531 RepID=A0ABV3XFE3_9ACTN
MSSVDARGSTGEPLRVLVLDHCAQLSGAELALVRLLPHVPGVDFTVLLAEDGPLADRLRAVGVRVEVLPLAVGAATLRRDRISLTRPPVKAIWYALTYAWRLARVIRQEAPDLVHTNSNKAHLYGGVAARIARVPHVWHARDRIDSRYMSASAAALSRLAVWTLPRLVIANSRSTLATVAPRWRRGRTVVLPEPVEQTPRQDPVHERDDGLTVGMVGRITPWKGQDVFLRAFAQATHDRPHSRAVIVGSAMFGETDYLAELHQLVAELDIDGRVTFTGFSDDVPAELQAMDVLVHASLIPEPFGQVVTEGMAAGLAVLAADAGGPSEILEHGVTGLLHPPGDVDLLAEHIQLVARDPRLRASMGAEARRASRAYDVGLIAAHLHRVYADVLGRCP